MAAFKWVRSNEPDAPERLIQFEDLSYILIDEINSVFGKHGEILGLCIEKCSADILFRKPEQAEAALHAHNGKVFHGKVLKISLRADDDASVTIKQEPEDCRIVFVPRCDLKPRVEKLEINHDQDKQDFPINNIQDSQIDITPNSNNVQHHDQNQLENQVPFQQDVKPNSEELSQALKEVQQRMPFMKKNSCYAYREFEFLLNNLGTKCSRIYFGRLHLVIWNLLKRTFNVYGGIRAWRVQSCCAMIQLGSTDQADVACKAEGCDELFGQKFVLKRCCNFKNRKRDKHSKKNGVSLICRHGKKRKNRESDQQTSIPKRFRSGLEKTEEEVVKCRLSKKHSATKRRIHFEDLSYILSDKIKSEFGKHGEILGLCVEKCSAEILFRKPKEAEAALHAHNGQVFHGKVLNISMRANDGSRVPIKQEPEDSDRIVFLPRCDIKPKVEELEINNDQDKKDFPINNIQDSQIDITPNSNNVQQHDQNQLENQVAFQEDVKPNSEKLSQALEEVQQRMPLVKKNADYSQFESYLDELGSKCSRIYLGRLDRVVWKLLDSTFKVYGEIINWRVDRSFAVIQLNSREQADAACEAKGCKKLFNQKFVLKRCCSFRKGKKNRGSKPNAFSRKCKHEKKK